MAILLAGMEQRSGRSLGRELLHPRSHEIANVHYCESLCARLSNELYEGAYHLCS